MVRVVLGTGVKKGPSLKESWVKGEPHRYLGKDIPALVMPDVIRNLSLFLQHF